MKNSFMKFKPKMLKKKFEKKIINSLKQTEKHALKKAKELVPVKSGRLRDSLSTEREKYGVSIKTDVPYAKYVEYGNKRQEANPFMTKTLFSMQKFFVKNFKKLFKEK